MQKHNNFERYFIIKQNTSIKKLKCEQKKFLLDIHIIHEQPVICRLNKTIYLDRRLICLRNPVNSIKKSATEFFSTLQT